MHFVIASFILSVHSSLVDEVTLWVYTSFQSVTIWQIDGWMTCSDISIVYCTRTGTVGGWFHGQHLAKFTIRDPLFCSSLDIIKPRKRCWFQFKTGRAFYPVAFEITIARKIEPCTVMKSGDWGFRCKTGCLYEIHRGAELLPIPAPAAY